MQKTKVTFSKEERLSSKKLIDKLFNRKNQFKTSDFPLLLIAKEVEKDHFNPLAQALFVVPKKRIKLAVKRNLTRRRLKEAYRLHKTSFYKQLQASDKKYIIAFIYLENKPVPYHLLEKKIIVLLERLKNKIESSS